MVLAAEINIGSLRHIPKLVDQTLRYWQCAGMSLQKLYVILDKDPINSKDSSALVWGKNLKWGNMKIYEYEIWYIWIWNVWIWNLINYIWNIKYMNMNIKYEVCYMKYMKMKFEIRNLK